MINFKTDEEKLFVQFYADKIGNELINTIVGSLSVRNSDEAIQLSHFFWDMVDAAIQDEKSKAETPWGQSSEFIAEKVMLAISGYLERAGYETEWGKVSDIRNE